LGQVLHKLSRFVPRARARAPPDCSGRGLLGEGNLTHLGPGRRPQWLRGPTVRRPPATPAWACKENKGNTLQHPLLEAAKSGHVRYNTTQLGSWAANTRRENMSKFFIHALPPQPPRAAPGVPCRGKENTRQQGPANAELTRARNRSNGNGVHTEGHETQSQSHHLPPLAPGVPGAVPLGEEEGTTQQGLAAAGAQRRYRLS